MSQRASQPVTYAFYEPFINGRPHCTSVVVVNGANRGPIFANVLVDTGADHSILPLSAATQAGLMFSAPATPVATLGGTVNAYRVQACTLEIESKTVIVTVLFDPTGKLPPILGRDALLARCEFGFRATQRGQKSRWRWF